MVLDFFSQMASNTDTLAQTSWQHAYTKASSNKGQGKKT